MVQPWAGAGWGWQSLPRVGTEVAVAFMDGAIGESVGEWATEPAWDAAKPREL